MKPALEPDPLSRALATWRVAPRRNPRFRAEVWARIETVRRVPTWSGYLRAHGALVAGALAVAVVTGAWRGREEARERNATARAELVAEYVHGLDARWMRSP
jgi:hypothetical protein